MGILDNLEAYLEKEDSDNSVCGKCGINKESIHYWEAHQTMSDNSIWCVR
jgi:hypothetical protein